MFIDRFKLVVTNITVPNEAAIVALRNAVWYDSIFRDDITLHAPSTLGDALHRASRYIELEEEKLILSRKHNPVKAAPAKDIITIKANTDEQPERRKHLDKNVSNGRKPATFVVNSDTPSNRPWNKYVRDADSPNPGPMYCEYQKSKAHSTENCRYLQILLMAKYKSGRIAAECDRVQANNRNQCQNESTAQKYIQDQEQVVQKEPTADSVKAEENELAAKRLRNGKAVAEEPKVVRQVRMIMGGLLNCNDSVRSIKEHRKKAEMKESWPSSSNMESEPSESEPISFTSDDLVGLDTPHNDPLVVELIIGDSRVTRVLIDTGSKMSSPK